MAEARHVRLLGRDEEQRDVRSTTRPDLVGERGLAKVKEVKIWPDAKRQRHALVGMTPG